MLRRMVHLLVLAMLAALVEAGIASALDHTRADATSDTPSYVVSAPEPAAAGGDQFIPIADFPKPVDTPPPPIPEPSLWASLLATAKSALDTCSRMVG